MDKLTARERAMVAHRAAVAPRTVDRYFAGATRETTAIHIERALKALKLARFIRGGSEECRD
jgi:hypothetical protein